MVKEFKPIKSRSLLEAVAKLIVFSNAHNDLFIQRAEFVGGIFEIDVDGVAPDNAVDLTLDTVS